MASHRVGILSCVVAIEARKSNDLMAHSHGLIQQPGIVSQVAREGIAWKTMFTVTGFFILLWVNTVSSTQWFPFPSCPENWDPSPCECDVYLTEINVFCRKPSITLEQVKEVFSRLNEPTVFHGFYLFDTSIKTLPSGLFGEKASFKNFKFSGNPLETVMDGAFQGSEKTVESIFFEGSRLSKLSFSSLYNLENLYMFKISDDSGLTSIPDDAFVSNPKLAFIGLRGNQIKRVGKRAFAKLPKLLSLDLAENQIASLDEESISFRSSGMARPRVYLNNNTLMSSQIHPKAFLKLAPEQLELDNNYLQHFDEETFQGILEFQAAAYPPDYVNIGKISVVGNPFRCERSLLWLVSKPGDYKKHVTGFECPDGTPLDEVTEDTLEHFTHWNKVRGLD